jgi:hypothetical protein
MVDNVLFIIPFGFHYLSSMNSNTLDILTLEVDLVMLGAPLKSITKNLNHDKILIYENPSC